MPEIDGSSSRSTELTDSRPDVPNTQANTSATVGSGPRRSMRRKILDAITSVGPFAAALTVYGLLLDNLQDRWFTYIALKYILAGVAALAAGMAVRLATGSASSRNRESQSTVTTRTVPASISSDTSSFVTNSPFFILAETASALQNDFRVDQRDDKEIVGWSQYLGDTVPPSAIGTSYGLRLAMMLDLRNHQVSYSKIVQSLLNLECAGGGWAASTGRGIGRPEVTAWVLGAAARAGLDHTKLEGFAELLQRLIQEDPIARDRTTVVSQVISTLADIAPKSPVLRDLVRALSHGAITSDGSGSKLFWGETLQKGAHSSAPHTARAIIALKRAAQVLPGADDLNASAVAGMRWLNENSDVFQDNDEQLRRPVPGGYVDAIFIGHFSSAWTSRALMMADDFKPYEDTLRRAMRDVVAKQQQGVWHWHDDTAPMWMSYQGVNALRSYLLRGLAWPP